MKLRKHIFFLLFLIGYSTAAQKVTVSEDINLRTDFMYDILGKVDNKILLYRDKGQNHMLQVFDDNLWEKEQIELQFEKKRIDAVGLVPGEKDFAFFYAYRKKGDQILSCRKFDADGALVDTATIAINNALLSFQKFFYAYSKNKRYVALFNFEKDNAMRVYLFDALKMQLMWSNIYAFDFQFVRRDFREMIISDFGSAFMIFEKDNFKLGKSNATIESYYLEEGNGDLIQQTFSLEDKYLVDYAIDFDNVNQRLVFAGLYGDRFRSRANGYFVLKGNAFEFTAFDQALFNELEKNNKRKVNSLEDYMMEDIILREDGGLILVAEMQREFSRKSNMLEGRRQSFDVRAYTDYYNEDMVIISLHPNGKEHWRKVLRKKQFSQDDGGYYSSFFVFKSPTELRFIFNDEIKQDNTVSEYIVNPLGENERNIVMNTEYQKLRLRFQEAIQISPSDFLVPSERNTKFNLVKVSF